MRNKSEVIYLYSYFISIILIAPFTLTSSANELHIVATLSLWVALATATTLGAANMFRRDVASGRLEYIQLSPITLEAVVFSKWLAFYGLMLLPLMACLPIAGLLYQLSAAELAHSAIGMAAGAAALTMLGTLVTAITSSMEKAGAAISLIVLPLTIPVMIFGAAYCRDLSAIWQPNLLFMLGLSALLLPIMCFAGASAIRASH